VQPRYYQREAVDAVWNHLCSAPGNPLVVTPTGSGKSLIAAMLCQEAVERFSGRAMVIAHRRELLVQNAEKIRKLIPEIPVGLFSAGLGRNQINEPIIVGGIQSLYKKAIEFGKRNLLIFDECHLVPFDGEGMYLTFIRDMQQLNPNIRIVGMTATDYRTNGGKIARADSIFNKVVYQAKISRLIREGYLCPLESPPTEASVDTSGLHIRGGEFVQSEMALLFDDDAKIKSAVKEVVEKTTDRRSILIFSPSVYHAAKTTKAISELSGSECEMITGDTLPMERASNIERFKSGSLRFLVNVDVLTTGFDAPNIDAIAVLRATMSPGLFSQIVGRGLRTAPGKDSCLILDFGENLKRFGPIDADDFGEKVKQRSTGSGGDAPTKSCPSCEEPNPISARVCTCGWKFPEPSIASHGTNPDGSPILEADIPPTVWIVEEVHASRHVKKNNEHGSPDTMRIDYVCVPEDGTGGNLERKTISEWVCIEHDGFARSKAALWWSARSNAPCPTEIDSALSLWGRGALASPTKLTTRPQGKFVRIVSVELDSKPESWAEESELVDAFEEADLPF